MTLFSYILEHLLNVTGYRAASGVIRNEIEEVTATHRTAVHR
jgi:hypothetical protein